MIAVYSNNILTDHCIGQLKFGQSYQIYHSIEQYLTADAKIKIAFVNHLNSYEPPDSEELRLYQGIDGRKFSNEIGQLKTLSDLVVAFDNEIHPYHFDIFRQHQQSNVFWVLPGYINDSQLIDPKNIILWNQHIEFLVDPYRKTLSHKLNELTHTTSKPMYFDALLGNRRAHRDFVYDTIQSQNLQEQILTTYMNQKYIGIGDLLIDDNFKTYFEWESDIEHLGSAVTRPSDRVQYQGLTFALYNILPIQVYNRTAYSIVAETGLDNRYSFFTEKIAKPIMARRLFVMFSGHKFLQNLRNLGFQTFDNIIDESYDLMYNDNDRWSAAFEQVQRLCKMDQSEVFAKIAPAVEHNYSLLMNTDWEQHMLDQLQQKLNRVCSHPSIFRHLKIAQVLYDWIKGKIV
jgi:hypothetical protein